MSMSRCCITLFEALIPVTTKAFPSAAAIKDQLLKAEADGLDLTKHSLREALMLGHLMAEHSFTKVQANVVLDLTLAARATEAIKTLAGSPGGMDLMTALVPLDQRTCSVCTKYTFGIVVEDKFVCLKCGASPEHKDAFMKVLLGEAKSRIGDPRPPTKTVLDILKMRGVCAPVQVLLEQLTAGTVSLPDNDRRDVQTLATSLGIDVKDLTDVQLVGAIHAVTEHNMTPEEVATWSKTAFSTPMLH